MPKIDVTANIILYNLMLPSPVYSSLSSLWSSEENYAKMSLPAITAQLVIRDYQTSPTGPFIFTMVTSRTQFYRLFDHFKAVRSCKLRIINCVPPSALLAFGLDFAITLHMNVNFLLEHSYIATSFKYSVPHTWCSFLERSHFTFCMQLSLLIYVHKLYMKQPDHRIQLVCFK
jgi:hypothetical protein